MTDTPYLLDIEANLVQASHGKRFANYIIDLLVCFVIVFILSFVSFIIYPSLAIEMDDSSATNLILQLTWMLLFAFVMGSLEALTKGRTVGKYITGTKAVNMDGKPITAGTAFARGFFRIVPFEAFSALGSPCFPWHDKWSKTYVVDIKESTFAE